MKNSYIKLIHRILSILIAVFFIYKGYGKFTSDKYKPIDEQSIITTIIDNSSYDAPVGYNIVMNTFKYSGFLDMISLIQILVGILIVIPFTRLLGLLTLLPIIFNIFFMHVFFDNRVDENIETGFLLIINILLLLYYKKEIMYLFLSKK
tara:strand:+ start:156 stop:602 length:447 start_codon:yes stop_codon:yes gene_type:complete